jgi:hypothetical protein
LSNSGALVEITNDCKAVHSELSFQSISKHYTHSRTLS